MSVNVEEEGAALQEAAEEILRAGDTYKPTMRFFHDGKLRGEIVIRDVEGEADKRAAFTEACILIPYLRADEIILAFDDFISTKQGITAVDDPNRHEAVCMIVASEIGAMCMIMPYTRDEEGNFSDWGQRQDDANPTALDDNLIYTLAHFLQYRSPAPKYSQVLMNTLKNRGHGVTIHKKDRDPRFVL